MAKRKRVAGDGIKINITPPSTTFPWVRVFKYPYGLRAKKSKIVTQNLGPDGKSQRSRRILALEIGEAVIGGSKVLSRWFR